jgi:hypothetical protein
MGRLKIQGGYESRNVKQPACVWVKGKKCVDTGVRCSARITKRLDKNQLTDGGRDWAKEDLKANRASKGRFQNQA